MNSDKIYSLEFFKEFIRQLKKRKAFKNLTELGNMIDSSQSYISQITTGKVPLTKDFADKLYSVFPPDEIVDMQADTVDNHLPEWQKDIIVTENEIYTNNFGVQFIPVPNGKYQMIVPMLNAAAQASFLDYYQDVEYITTYPEVESFIVDKPMQGNYVCFKTINDSMTSDNPLTAILPDDILLTRELKRDHWRSKLKTFEFPEWVIYTTRNPYPLLKNISNHDVENGIITCHSYNEMIPDFDLNLDEVQALFYVIDIKRKRNNKYFY